MVRGFPSVKVMLSKELGELWLDAAQGLGIPVKQQHHVHHGEALTDQGQQVAKETCTHTRHMPSVSPL